MIESLKAEIGRLEKCIVDAAEELEMDDLDSQALVVLAAVAKRINEGKANEREIVSNEDRLNHIAKFAKEKLERTYNDDMYVYEKIIDMAEKPACYLA